MKTFIATSGADRWEIVALDQYQAAVKLRAQLRLVGRSLPTDIVWTVA